MFRYLNRLLCNCSFYLFNNPQRPQEQILTFLLKSVLDCFGHKRVPLTDFKSVVNKLFVFFASWPLLVCYLGLIGTLLGHFSGALGLIGTLWALLGRSWGVLGVLLGALGRLLGLSWDPFWCSWALRGYQMRLQGRFLRRLGGSGEHFGSNMACSLPFLLSVFQSNLVPSGRACS